MKQIVLSIGLLLVLTTQVQSQDLTKKEKIKALFSIMHQDSLMIKTMDRMAGSMTKNMASMFSDTIYSKMDIDISKMTQKIMEKSMQKSKEISLRLVNEDMVDIYDKYFTIGEIDDFSNFYKSKSGQKMLTQMPDISQDIMNVMNTKYMADFMQILRKDMEEMRNEIINEDK